MHRSTPSRSRLNSLAVGSCLALPALALVLALGCTGHNYHTPQPTLAGFTPANGQASTLVTVYGTGFDLGILGASLGGVPVSSSAIEVGVPAYSMDPNNDNTSVTFPVPPSAVSGPIVVTTSGGSVTTANFTVIPVVSEVTPDSGSLAAGTPVTVEGYGLMGITKVLFGTTQATPTSQTANQIVVPLPAGTPLGALQITFVVNPTYTLPNLQWAFTANP